MNLEELVTGQPLLVAVAAAAIGWALRHFGIVGPKAPPTPAPKPPDAPPLPDGLTVEHVLRLLAELLSKYLVAADKKPEEKKP